MVRPNNKIEALLLSVTKKCEMLVKQSHTKPQETLEFKRPIPRESFAFQASIILGLDSNWMVGLTSLEVYNSVFNITEESNKFDLYTDISAEFSFEKLKDELEEILGFSNITPSHLQHEIIGLCRIIYRAFYSSL